MSTVRVNLQAGCCPSNELSSPSREIYTNVKPLKTVGINDVVLGPPHNPYFCMAEGQSMCTMVPTCGGKTQRLNMATPTNMEMMSMKSKNFRLPPPPM